MLRANAIDDVYASALSEHALGAVNVFVDCRPMAPTMQTQPGSGVVGVVQVRAGEEILRRRAFKELSTIVQTQVVRRPPHDLTLALSTAPRKRVTTP